MREKCEQLVTCLKHLIEILEEMSYGTTNTILDA